MKTNVLAQTGKQQGFTLIELIVVIVILGILAATALPKFADLKSDANSAALKGIAGAMSSAASMAHGVQLAKGYASNVQVVIDGGNVTMSGGYPTANAAGIAAALNAPDYSWQAVPGGMGKNATCFITYVNAGAGTFPTIGTGAAGSAVAGC